MNNKKIKQGRHLKKLTHFPMQLLIQNIIIYLNQFIFKL